MNLDINPQEKREILTAGKQQWFAKLPKHCQWMRRLLFSTNQQQRQQNQKFNELFAIIDDLRAKGVGIIFIFLPHGPEIRLYTDRVTVMRDGEYVGTSK